MSNLYPDDFSLAEQKQALKKGMSSHQSTAAQTDEWLTPPEIIKALGPFDLDPCAPVPARRPWPTAAKHYDLHDNGLLKPWNGRVWCNPPYGLNIGKWLGRCAEHKDALVLIFARVETDAWHKHIWNQADAVFFFRGRIAFHQAPDGRKARFTGGAPSALIAYGQNNFGALWRAKNAGAIEGKLLEL